MWCFWLCLVFEACVSYVSHVLMIMRLSFMALKLIFEMQMLFRRVVVAMVHA